MAAFDSFEGLPEPAAALDRHPAFVPGYGQCGLDQFVERCDSHGVPRDAYSTVPGFFETSLPGLGGGPPLDIALAYVDCNMYTSTVTVLEFLAPRMKHGMILAFDDYFCWSPASGLRSTSSSTTTPSGTSSGSRIPPGVELRSSSSR